MGTIIEYTLIGIAMIVGIGLNYLMLEYLNRKELHILMSYPVIGGTIGVGYLTVTILKVGLADGSPSGMIDGVFVLVILIAVGASFVPGANSYGAEFLDQGVLHVRAG